MSDSDSDVEVVGTSHDVHVLPADLARLLSDCNTNKVPCSVKSIVTGSPSALPLSLSACRGLKEADKKYLRSFARGGKRLEGPLSAVTVLLESTEYTPAVLSPRNSWLSVRTCYLYITSIVVFVVK